MPSALSAGSQSSFKKSIADDVMCSPRSLKNALKCAVKLSAVTGAARLLFLDRERERERDLPLDREREPHLLFFQLHDADARLHKERDRRREHGGFKGMIPVFFTSRFF
jgi:hypothetical protein